MTPEPVHCPVDAFEPMPAYAVGDKVSVDMPRAGLSVWWDRVRLWRWDVPRTEKQWFLCTSTSPGALWPSVDA